jgi:DNA polymerase-3 subunit beta
MKLTAPQDVLAAACGWTAATARLAKTPPSPVLAGLLLTADHDGTLTVAGFDYEVAATATMTAEVGEPGRALVPARLLTQAVAALPGPDLTLASDGTRLTLAAGQVTYTLATLPHEDYPALPDPGTEAAEIGADALAAAVTQVVGAASRDDTLPALTCVHLTLDGNGTATLAATDRYRLAVATCPYTPAPDAPAPGPVLVPARELAAVTKRPGTPALTLTLAADGSLAGFATADRQVTTRLIAGEFPRYETLIPTGSDLAATVTADLATLTGAIKRAAVVAERNTPVRLAFTATEALIESGTGDDAALTETIPVTLDGGPQTIAFNPAFLLDTLTAIAAIGSNGVRIGITSTVRPALLTPVQARSGSLIKCCHVLMPVRGAG